MDIPVHEMILRGTTDSGAEAWECPECGRKMLVTWPPNFSKRVVYAGNEYAVHTGSKGAVRMHGVEVLPDIDTTVPDTELEWLNSNGIKWE